MAKINSDSRLLHKLVVSMKAVVGSGNFTENIVLMTFLGRNEKREAQISVHFCNEMIKLRFLKLHAMKNARRKTFCWGEEWWEPEHSIKRPERAFMKISYTSTSRPNGYRQLSKSTKSILVCTKASPSGKWKLCNTKTNMVRHFRILFLFSIQKSQISYSWESNVGVVVVIINYIQPWLVSFLFVVSYLYTRKNEPKRFSWLYGIELTILFKGRLKQNK